MRLALCEACADFNELWCTCLLCLLFPQSVESHVTAVAFRWTLTSLTFESHGKHSSFLVASKRSFISACLHGTMHALWAAECFNA
jgi:hypothetical protein